MTEFSTREVLARIATVTEAPHVSTETWRTEIDRSFELPTELYAVTVGLYLGFVGVMAMAFMNAELFLPMVIFAFFIVAAFGTPALWARMEPAKRLCALTYGAFRNRGIHIATGHLDAGAATVQVLILPVLIFLWGVTVTGIAAFTR